jgi:hypothetical protein
MARVVEPGTPCPKFHDAGKSFLRSVGLCRDVGIGVGVDDRLLCDCGCPGPTGALGQRAGDCRIGVTGRQAQRIRGRCFGARTVGATRGRCEYSRCGARQSLYVVDPNGGSLHVTANGGAGGCAGAGGSGLPSGFSGLDGRPGWGGYLGADGAAGTTTESVDPAAQPFMNCVSWSNHSGGGAPGPAPRITIEPVPALW